MRRAPLLLLLPALVAAALTTPSAGAAPPPPAAPSLPAPAVFRVGAAVTDLRPQVPVSAGGSSASPPITKVNDALQARAVLVANRERRAVAVVVVDAQAWFAAVQDDPELGLDAVRARAARQVTARTGLRMTASDVVVSSTHSHAAPSLQGIWGPIPKVYFQKVADRVVEAVTRAALAARPATLEVATADMGELVSTTIPQNSFPGFALDAQATVLRARGTDGGTVATLALLPAHDATVLGAAAGFLSADFYGVTRRVLDDQLGGVSIVGPATLGRMQTPVENFGSAAGLPVMEWFGRASADLVTTALGRARPLTSDTLRSAESRVTVPGSTPLLALVAAYRLPEAQRQEILSRTGLYPINRSDQPPHQTGNLLGIPLTVLRIADTAWVSQPGEPFPEVRYAIAAAVRGATVVTNISKAQDDIGYYYPPQYFPLGFVYPVDTSLFNISPVAGDEIVLEQVANLGRVGFDTTTPAPALLPHEYAQITRPGLQLVASDTRASVMADGLARVRFQAVYAPPVLGDDELSSLRVTWGDGSPPAEMPFLLRESKTVGGDRGTGRPALVDHAWTRPGAYRVVVSGTTDSGRVLRDEVRVTVLPRLRAAASCRREGSTAVLTPRASGGDGRVLDVRWTAPSGSVRAGTLRVPVASAPVRLRVTDGSGTYSSTRIDPRAC